MTKTEFEIKVKDLYPKFFERLHNCTEYTSCMYWGLSVGPGWLPLVEEAAQKIEALNQNVICEQVKEKFGELTIYIDNPTEDAYNILREVRHKASGICEDCGQPGTFRNQYWLRTQCDACDLAYLKRRKEED